jgi:hypothetical protein
MTYRWLSSVLAPASLFVRKVTTNRLWRFQVPIPYPMTAPKRLSIDNVRYSASFDKKPQPAHAGGAAGAQRTISHVACLRQCPVQRVLFQVTPQRVVRWGMPRCR